jgi:hypothetical protein
LHGSIETANPWDAPENRTVYTNNFDLSLDGKQIAVAKLNPGTSQYDIWLLDWARGVPTRLTFDPALSPFGNVAWSSDGLRLAFTSERKGNRDIFEKKTSGAGDEITLIDSPTDEWVEDWSKDGRSWQTCPPCCRRNEAQSYSAPSRFSGFSNRPLAAPPFKAESTT